LVHSSSLCYNQNSYFAFAWALNTAFASRAKAAIWRKRVINTAYLYAGILLAAGFIFVIVTMTLVSILSPHKRTKEKLQTYESGETPIGSAWVQYPLGFYIFALLFVAFDVDIVFIISWAVIFKKLSFFGFFEILIFIIILALGLAYAWRKGVIRWI
ncbi:MAG TPA: NADH-quinone oxidoreductase subunit A, partial [Ktedonobacteraceae bacterium]|nr:NADH-quinone oxidoreductase subunit A [Ktedonobacteraceae bacterium]